MSIPLGTVAHFTVPVKNPEASAGWWLSLFDLEEYRRTPTRVLLGNDSVLIVLRQGQPNPEAFGHLAFAARDVAALEAARDFMREKGVDLEDPGDEIGPVAPGSSSLGIWFHDPDGYRWELMAPGA